jgi:four helix bundle protein
LNIEHPTSNIEMKSEQRPYDLDERLLNYGASIINLTRVMTSDYAGRHVGNQLLRAGTAPLSHHGEAQAAESPADFIHKMRLALKELRESERWLKLIQKTNLLTRQDALPHALDETDQLIRIFVTSIATSEARKK